MQSSPASVISQRFKGYRFKSGIAMMYGGSLVIMLTVPLKVACQSAV